MKKILSIIILVCPFLISACGANEDKILEAISKTQTAIAGSSSQITERTIIEVIITATPKPEPESQPSTEDEILATPTETLPAQCQEVFSSLEVYGFGYLPNGSLMISIQKDGRYEQDAYRLFVESKDFSCTYIEAYPDRIYCTGEPPRPGTDAKLTLMPDAVDCELAILDMTIPLIPTQTPEPEKEKSSSYP